MPKTRPPYDEEFRREAVGLLARGERSLAALSSELGVSQQTLRTWRRRAGVEAGKVEVSLPGFDGDRITRIPTSGKEVRFHGKTIEVSTGVDGPWRPAGAGVRPAGRAGRP